MTNTKLKKIAVFNTFTESEITEALHILCAQTTHYSKETLIYQEGTLTDKMGLILSGSVRIERIDYQGNRSILSHIGKHQIFAETYALLPDEPLMIDVVANTDCDILFLNLKRIETPEAKHCLWYSTLIVNLLHISSRKNLELSARHFHTASKYVRGRVLSFLLAQSRHVHSLEFDIPFNRQQMADYLNLDRSALSFELSKMQAEGILCFHKNHFCLLHPLK